MTDLMTRYGDFANGVALRDMAVLATHSGKVFWVSSTAGGDGNEGSFDRPLATIDAAIGKCSASRGDIIMVKAGHAETLTAASAITCDIAGVSIIGCGNGADRPELTFGTSTGASVVISAANVTIQNIIGVAGVNALTNPFHVQAADCTLDIEWRDDASNVEAARVVLTTAAADRFRCRLRYYGQTGGSACVNAVRLVGCNEGWLNIDFYGKASTAIVEFLTTACTGIRVVGNFYNSGTTDGSKNVVDTVTGSTWWANIFDGAAGAPYTGGSGSSLAQDDVSAISAALYGAAGIGTYPAAAAAANSVSIAEVLRYVQDRVAAAMLNRNSTNYLAVTADFTSATWNTAASHEILTVTGACHIIILPQVTGTPTSAGSGATLVLGDETTSNSIIASTDAENLATGEWWFDATDTRTLAARSIFEKTDIVVGNGKDIGYTIGTEALTGGSIVFHVWWEPIDATGAVVAGAGGAL